MDSGLLNVFHDDTFDGNYVKYDDNDADFWSSSSETMGMQLAETLHGILPIAPTDDASLLYGNTILKDDYGFDCKDDAMSALQTKHASIFDDFTENHVGSDGSIQIVDTNEFESGDDDDDYDDDDDDDDDGIDMSDIDETGLDDADVLSQNSNITFRTRTDSSSIGDYESHSSDYDDDDERENDVDDDDDFLDSALGYTVPVPNLTISSDLGVENNINCLKLPTEENFTSRNKSRTFSTTTIGSDVDGLGLHIDASTFDLAEFITEDDFAPIISLTSTKAINEKEELPVKAKPEAFGIPAAASTADVHPVISCKQVDSDSDDSDVIVDVETVEFDAETENQLFSIISTLPVLEAEGDNADELVFEDNVRSDPSWSPTKTKSKKELPSKEIKPTTTLTTPIKGQQMQQQQNFSRNLSLVPNKRQCEFLKGKFGSGRSKNGSGQRNLKPAIKPSQESKVETTKVKTKDQVAAETLAAAKKKVVSKPQPDTVNVRKVLGVGQGGKNLSLIKQRRYSSSEQSSEKTPNRSKSYDATPPPKVGGQPQSTQPDTPQLKAIKRKLNLEEYKQRRGAVGTGENNGLTNQKDGKLENTVGDQRNSIGFKAHSSNSTQTLSNTSVASIVQTLKAQAMQPKFAVDPITEAKNKVLRMQEQKKAQLLKIIDSTVSAKVPRVTKILPLKDMVKDSLVGGDRKDCAYSAANELRNSSGPAKYENNYEEIVIVSASTNTEISIPPLKILPNCVTDTSGTLKYANNASRSLLKSSALLYNISNTFEKVRASENVKLTPNSLITSIHRVVAKQTIAPLATASESSRKDGVANLNCSKKSTTSTDIANKVNKAEQHGEDKVIMHLRKDRIRNRTCSASMQTEILPEFPPLLLLTKTVERKSRERKRMRNMRRNCRQRNAEGSQRQCESEDFSCYEEEHSSYRSRSRSPFPAADSYSSPSERLRRSDGAGVGGGGYSSRSSRHHRSSISSSYSESECIPTRRSRKSYIKQRSSKKHSRSRSNSIEYSDCSRSRSRSRSRNRNRRRLYRFDSRSCTQSRSRSRSRSRSCTKRIFVDRNVSQPAVEERRIVYVGRIEPETNKEMLRRKFVAYGPIKQITIHYKDTGMKYGFVTYERSQDAFTVIDKSSRDPHINMYDISFGGRRAFCRASYADLDNAGINTYQSFVFPQVAPEPKAEDSFEALLLKVKAKMNANKSSSNTTSNAAII